MKIEIVLPSDAKQLLGIYRPYVLETAVSFECEVPTETEFKERIARISRRYPFLKAVEDGQILGYACAHRFREQAAYDWAVETTIYLRQDARRRGIGRALYEALERSLKEMGVLNMNACIAVPKKEDPRLTSDSVRFHEKMGFRPVGVFHDVGRKFDVWYDMLWMEKAIGPHEKDQRPVDFGKKAAGTAR